MSVEDNVFKGQDFTAKITVRDKESQAIINLNTAEEIILRICDAAGNTVDKYSKTVLAGFRQLIIADPLSGIVEAKVNAAQTDTAREGVMTAEIKLRFDDADFEDNTRDGVDVIEELATMNASKTKGDL